METKTRVSRILKGFDGRWVFTAENMKGVTSQSILREDEKEFPLDKVKKWMSEGKLITWIGHGEYTWIVIANRLDSDLETPQQELYVDAEFPEDAIKAAWKKNFRISLLNYCNNQWVMVTEQNKAAVVGQGLSAFDDIDEAKAEIQKWWPQNKAIHSLVYGQKKWIMISQQMEGSPGQAFTLNSDWPSDKIEQYFKNSKYLTCVAQNPEEEFWVIVASPIPGGQTLSTTETYPYEKIKKCDSVYLYGVRE